MLPTSIQDSFNRIFCSCVRRPGDTLIDDHEFVTRPVKVGDHILLYGRRRSQFPFHCLVGPDWPFVALVLSLIFIVNVVILYVISPLGWPPVLIGAIGALLLLGSYSSVAFSDPGIVFRNDYPSHQQDISTPSSQPHISHRHESLAILENPHTTNSAASSPLNSLDDVENGGEERLLPSEPSVETHKTNIALTPPFLSQSPPLAPSSNSTRVTFALERTMECGNCQLHRPMTARHCSYCKVCINELDHHCPW